jgi:uncharacterized protein with HEPN domain
MKEERFYLIHIAQCIEKIEQYTQTRKSTFLTDTKTQDAVIRNFEIIGEAIKRLSAETRQSAAEFPWKRWASFRDVLIHQYDGIDPVEVWLTVEQDLPNLKQAITVLLSTLPKPGDS